MATAGVLAGMAAAAGAAACFDGAVLLQAGEARAVAPEHGLRVALVRRLAARPRWLLGLAVAVVGWPLQLAAFALAPVTVVQPLLALGLVLLLAAGRRVLGEPVRRRDALAAAVVVAGVALLALAAPRHTDQVPRAWALGLTSVLLLAVVAAPHARRARVGAWALIASAGCAFALAAITGKLVTVTLARGHIAAALGLAVATAACAAAGLLSDTTAMQSFAATRVAPPMFVLEVAIPVALAPALFGERPASTAAAAALVTGLVLVLAGGAALGASRAVASGLHLDADVVASPSTRSAAAGRVA